RLQRSPGKGKQMGLIAGTKIRAIENYESKKERWLIQVAADTELPAGALRVAIAISQHMNRKQRLLALARIRETPKASRHRPQHGHSRSQGVRAPRTPPLRTNA